MVMRRTPSEALVADICWLPTTRRGANTTVPVVASLAAGVVTVAFLLWMVLSLGGPRLTDAVDDLGELVAALVAAGACAVAATKVAGRRTCWWWLAASAAAWGAGEAAWSYYDLVRGVQVPFPSLADVGFLSSVPMAVIGLTLFPGAPRRMAHRFQDVLDGAIIAGSLLFASWATVLGPLYKTHSGGIFKETISLAYPVSDVIMVAIVIILFARSGQRGRLSLLLVMAGIVCFAVADSSFAYLTEVNKYGNGTFLDTGWVAGYLLIGLGAIWAACRPAAEVGAPVTPLSMVAPYVPVLAVLVVTAIELLGGHRISTVSWIMAFALIALVLGRQLLILWDQAVGERRAGRRRTHYAEEASIRPPSGTRRFRT
jgi:diguanylate cyclase